MNFRLFGFNITRPKAEETKSFVPPSQEDGALAIGAGGYHGHYLDIDGDIAKNDVDQIKKYRAAAQQPECDSAIEDIVNEAIISDENEKTVEVHLDDLDQPEEIKVQIRNEFDNLLELLNFSFNGHDIFRKWYIDGRLYYHVVVNEEDRNDGIQELRPIDATKIRKVREQVEKIDPKTGAKLIESGQEYFLYQENGVNRQEVGLRIAKDSVVYVPSGLLDPSRKRVEGYLQKAIKPVNQLRMMEDSLVIYRISRAPERRIFYVDVGNLPKGKAEEYLKGIMNQYRNKLVYDAQSGEIRDDRKHMSILEDFWLPRREGGRGTEIDTLAGAENLGQIDDIIFFQKKLYRSLNIPVSRLEQEGGFNIGRSSEISRDEIKFQKFVDRIRKKFSLLFLDLLRIQLVLKNIITEEDWPEFKENIQIDFRRDNHYAELKNTEILTERMNLLTLMSPFVGDNNYYSMDWVRKNVLKLTDEDIAAMRGPATLDDVAAVTDIGPADDREEITPKIAKVTDIGKLPVKAVVAADIKKITEV